MTVTYDEMHETMAIARMTVWAEEPGIKLEVQPQPGVVVLKVSHGEHQLAVATIARWRWDQVVVMAAPPPVMTPKPIETVADYWAALARIKELMDAKADTPEGYELDQLATRVQEYEAAHTEIPTP